MLKVIWNFCVLNSSGEPKIDQWKWKMHCRLRWQKVSVSNETYTNKIGKANAQYNGLLAIRFTILDLSTDKVPFTFVLKNQFKSIFDLR